MVRAGDFDAALVVLAGVFFAGLLVATDLRPGLLRTGDLRPVDFRAGLLDGAAFARLLVRVVVRAGLFLEGAFLVELSLAGLFRAGLFRAGLLAVAFLAWLLLAWPCAGFFWGERGARPGDLPDVVAREPLWLRP